MFLLKKYKARTPGHRHKLIVKQFEFLKKYKYYFFLKSKKNKGGRNNTGTITVRHKGSLIKKKKIVLINKLRLNMSLFGILIGIYKQKYNMCYLGLIKLSNGSYQYIYIPHGLKLSSYIYANDYNTKKLKITLGVLYFFVLTYLNLRFFNICSLVSKRSIYAKSAGVFCSFISKNKERGFIKIYLPSKKIKYLYFKNYYCTLGRASNIHSYKQVVGKAGYTRKIGVRPTVRGVAMNPVDHPHGGRTKTNQPEKTPWGRIAKHNK